LALAIFDLDNTLLAGDSDYLWGTFLAERGLLDEEEHQRENGRYTGEVAGTPSFREGKVQRLLDWLQGTGAELAGSTFYSDSHNDIPLLERVDYPVAVDPDEHLRRHARDRGWRIISLRGREAPR
jgi:phosphoserine phosphatase